MEDYKDCLACGNSFSTKDNKLICILTDIEVEEDGVCDEFN